MAKCKDCLLVEMCYIIENYDADTNDDDVCENFKDHTKYVEVVRCKDCKMRCPESVCIAKHCTLTGIPVDDDDFCSYGERR